MSEPVEVMRWYTRALRIPRLVGKMPGGGHWPGGPYTVAQVVGGAVVAVAGGRTVGWWGRWGFVGDYAALAVAVVVVGWLLGRVRPGGRDPLSAALAVAGLYSQPRAGRWRGRQIRLPRPARVRVRVFAVIPAPANTPADAVWPPAGVGCLLPVADPGAAAAGEPAPVTPPPPVAVGAGALSELDRLLAAAAAGRGGQW